MVRIFVLLMFCACATAKPSARPEACQQKYDACNNACFAAPNYKRGGPQCSQTALFQVCPQENQIVDTVAAGKCFDQCEWDSKLCR